jgi:excisionase family DNA binding protein
MTVKEAAERLEISPSLVYTLCAEGRLQHLRIGTEGRRGKIVIMEKHLRAFLEKLETAAK